MKENSEERKTLFIVTCTKRKIWSERSDAPKYVPAGEAYIGSYMRRWLKSQESKKYSWLIFSSKYGLIEPDHPIRNYDIHFIHDPGAISETTVLRQILFQEFDGLKVKDFDTVYFVGSPDYYRKLKLIFAKAGMVLNYYELKTDRCNCSFTPPQ